MSNRLAMLSLVAAIVSACVPVQSYGPAPTPTTGGRAVTINGATPTPNEAQTLAAIEASYAVTLPDGAYWYDATSGAFGVWGQPTGAVITAGLDLGPPLPAEASSGTSGVYVNNRQLQVSEVQYLSNLVGGPLQPGRYFIDAQGNAGPEGGPAVVNLVQIANARRPASRSSASGNRNGETHITAGYGSNKSWFDSDGKGCKMFMTASGSVVSSGC